MKDLQNKNSDRLTTRITNEFDMFFFPKIYAHQVTLQLTCDLTNYVITAVELIGRTYSGDTKSLGHIKNLHVTNTFEYDFTFPFNKSVFIGNNQGYKNSKDWIKTLRVRVFGNNLPRFYIMKKPTLHMKENFTPVHSITETETIKPFENSYKWIIAWSAIIIVLIIIGILFYTKKKSNTLAFKLTT